MSHPDHGHGAPAGHAAPTTHHDEEHAVAPSMAHLSVLRTSDRNPHVRTVVVGRAPMGAEVTFLPAIIAGVAFTTRRFFQNLLFRKHTATVQYPEQKVTYPARYRALHRLMQRDDGTSRCVACMMCPTVCPARCITIVPGERADSHEKTPVVFEIDELRCVVCGLCVEACPCDAIRMDTAVHMTPVERRTDAILGKVDLLKRGTLSTAVQGGRGPMWREEEHPEEERGPGSKAPAAPR